MGEDRKYRHRGYQQSDSEPSGKRPMGPRPAARRGGSPRPRDRSEQGGRLPLQALRRARPRSRRDRVRGDLPQVRQAPARLQPVHVLRHLGPFRVRAADPRADSVEAGGEHLHVLLAREDLRFDRQPRASPPPTTPAPPGTRCSRSDRAAVASDGVAVILRAKPEGSRTRRARPSRTSPGSLASLGMTVSSLLRMPARRSRSSPPPDAPAAARRAASSASASR